MKAKAVNEHIDFKRGSNPHEQLGIGEGQPVEDLIQQAIDDTGFMPGLTFQDLKDHMETYYEEESPQKIFMDKANLVEKLDREELELYLGSPSEQWSDLLNVLSKLPKKDQVKWWISQLPS